jgi:hypothetical protein
MKCRERGSRDDTFLFFMCARIFQICVKYCMMHDLYDCFNKLHGRFHNSLHTKKIYLFILDFLCFLGVLFFSQILFTR